MFFGTPHRGADPRSGLHRVISASAIGIGMNVNRHIMDTLLPTIGRATDVDDFKMLAWEAKWTVYSFQEETGVGLLFGKKVCFPRIPAVPMLFPIVPMLFPAVIMHHHLLLRS